MVLGFALVVPTVGQVGPEVRPPFQRGAGHAQAGEVGLGQVAQVEAQALRALAIFDGELQQDQAFAGIGELRAGIEMDTQLLVALHEPEIGEAGRMGQGHARGDQLPARIAGQVLIMAVLAFVDRVGIVIGQRLVEIVRDRGIELELALVDQLQDGVGEDRLGDRGAVHDGVGL